jgi:predicted Zn-dependent peptidase
VSAGVDKTRVVEAVQAIVEECKKLTTELVPEAELRKVKDYIIGNTFLSLESSDSIANFIGGQEVLKGEVKKPLELTAKIEKVTAREIQKVAQEIFQNKNLNLAVVGDVTDQGALEKVLVF